jgi:tetratricopeptide (TPR) repeat protein
MIYLRRERIIIATLLLGSLLGHPVLAAEDHKAEASQFFTQGLELADQGRFEAAIQAFEAAYALAPHPTVLYNLGQAALAAGKRRQALDYFERYLREPAEMTADPSRRTGVEQIVAELRSEFPPPAQIHPPATTRPAVPAVTDSPPPRTAAHAPSRLALVSAALGVCLLASAGATYLRNDQRHESWSEGVAAHRSLGPPRTPDELVAREAQARELNRQLGPIRRADKINLALAASGAALTALAGALWWHSQTGAEPAAAIAAPDDSLFVGALMRW